MPTACPYPPFGSRMFDPKILPSTWRQDYWDAWSREERERWLALRRRAQTDAMFLGVDILGGDFVHEVHAELFAQFPQPNPDLPSGDWDRVCKKRLILWPRGTLKTSAVRVSIVQAILADPNVSILLLQGSQILAKRQIAVLKNVFASPTRRLADLFPEYVCKKPTGRTNEFIVAARTRTVVEPTCAITSAKCVKASSHWSMAFVDDLQHEQNWKNPEMLEKAWQQYLDLGPLMAPNALVTLTGTRYTDGDIYGRVLDNIAGEMKDIGSTSWKVSIKSCWSTPCKCGHTDFEHDEDRSLLPCKLCACEAFVSAGPRTLLMPKWRTRDGRELGWDFEFLERERRESGQAFFESQYLNSITSDRARSFPPALIDQQTLHDLKHFPDLHTGAATVFVGDLAYAGGVRTDKCVIWVCQFAPNGSIYIRDCVHGKYDSTQLWNALAKAAAVYRPRSIMLEKFQAWDVFDTAFRNFAVIAKMQPLPIQWIKMTLQHDAKLTRIWGISSRLTSRTLWLFSGMTGYPELVQQLKRFPKMRDTDYADALSLACQIPGVGSLPTPPPKTVSAIEELFTTPGEAEKLPEDNNPITFE